MSNKSLEMVEKTYGGSPSTGIRTKTPLELELKLETTMNPEI